MTLVWAKMAAGKQLVAWLAAMRYRVLARLSRLRCDGLEGSLAAWTALDDIRREGAVGSSLVLGMALLLASVVTTVKGSSTYLATTK